MAITRIGKGVTYIAILNAFQFVVGLVFYNIVSNVLPPAEIGVMATLNFAYTTFAVFAPLALPFGATKYVAEYLGKGQVENAAAVAKTTTKFVLLSSLAFLAVFVSIALVAGRTWASAANIEFFFITIFIAGFFAVLRNTHLALIQGLQLFDKYAIANLASMIMTRFLGIILVLVGLGLQGVALGILLGEVAGLSLTFFFYRGHLPVVSTRGDSKMLFKFSLPVFGMMVTGMFQDWSDRMLFLAVSRDLDALGLFDLAIRTATSLGIIGAVVDVVMLPALSDAYGRNGKRSIETMMTTAVRYLGFMYFPAAFGLATISHTAMTILYQAKLAEAGQLPLAILSIFSIFGAFATILSSGLKSIGRTSSFVRISLIALAVDGATVATLSPSIGLYGAVVARSASIVVLFLCTLFELRKEITLRVEWEGLWKGLLAATSIVPPLLLLDRYMHHPNIFLDLGAEVALAVVSYLLALLALKAVRKEDFHILRQIVPRRLTWFINALERRYLR